MIARVKATPSLPYNTSGKYRGKGGLDPGRLASDFKFKQNPRSPQLFKFKTAQHDPFSPGENGKNVSGENGEEVVAVPPDNDLHRSPILSLLATVELFILHQQPMARDLDAQRRAV